MKFSRFISALFLVFIWSFLSCDSIKEDNEAINNSIPLAIDNITYLQNSNSKLWDKSWREDNNLVFHIIGEPSTLHPTNEPSTIGQFIFQYTQLFILGKEMKSLSLRPAAVKDLPTISKDQLSYTYSLRDDISWDDQSPITLQDILFTLKVNKCPLVENPNIKSYFDNLESVILDSLNNTFTIKMKSAYVQNVAFLSDCPILQESFYDTTKIINSFTLSDFDSPNFQPDQKLMEWAKRFNSYTYGREVHHLQGAGPYQVTRWAQGESITLSKKDVHWTGSLANPSIYENAFPDQIIFKLNNDVNSQYFEFKNQTFDGSGYLSMSTLIKLQQDETFNRNYHSDFLPTFNYSYAAMNMRPEQPGRNKFFVDTKVRKAIALLTPIDEIMKTVFADKVHPAIGPVSPLKSTFNKELSPIPFDPEQAERLLTEAGWKDIDGDGILEKRINNKTVPFEFELLFMNNIKDWEDIARLMANSLKKAKINAKLKPVDFSVLFKKAQSHDFDMLLCAWGGSSFPDDHTQLWHTSSWLNNGSNFTGFGSATSDSLIELSKSTINENKHKDLEQQIQKIIYDEHPYVFLTRGTRRVVLHKRFHNAYMFSEKPGVLLNNMELHSPRISLTP